MHAHHLQLDLGEDLATRGERFWNALMDPVSILLHAISYQYLTFPTLDWHAVGQQKVNCCVAKPAYESQITA